MEWMERYEAQGAFESEEDVDSTDPEKLSRQVRGITDKIAGFNKK